MNQTPTAQDWTDAIAKPLDLAQMDELVRKSAAAWEIYDAKKKIATEALGAAEELDRQIIHALKDAGKKSYKVDGVGTMSLVQTATVTTPKSIEDKVRFFEFLKTDAGEEFMYSMMSVNSQTLNSWFKKKFEEAEAKGSLLGFSIPGVEPGATRESLSFRKDGKVRK